MSKPSALPSPRGAGEQAGADGAAGRPGEHAPGARPGRLLGAGDAAGGLHHERLREAGRLGRLAEPLQVAAEQRGEVGVDRRRRAALVLAEAGQDLVRGGDVDAGQLAAQALGDAPLVARGRGRRRAGRARPTRRRCSRTSSRQALGLAVGERLDDALGPDPLGRLEAQLRLDQRRRLRGAEPVEVGPVLAADLEQVGEAAGGDQRRAGAAFLEQRVGADGHPVGEGLDRAGLGAGPPQHLLDRGDHRDRLVLRRGRQLRRVDRSPSTRTASVKVPPTSTPSSMG